MSLETQLNHVLDCLLNTNLEQNISKMQLIQSMDLTLLDKQATPQALDWVVEQANVHQVAAICVYMQHLHRFKPAPSHLNLATVLNFPQGTLEITRCIDELNQARILGANEIDYVFPYQSYLAGNRRVTLAHCAAVAAACQKLDLKFKVILETGAFLTMSSIYEVSQEVLSFGCDFLKTSTGKINEGATLSAVFAMLSAIKDSGSGCGIKVSGGIKTIKNALNYAHLAELMNGKKINPSWFRIGASSLLKEILT